VLIVYSEMFSDERRALLPAVGGCHLVKNLEEIEPLLAIVVVFERFSQRCRNRIPLSLSWLESYTVTTDTYNTLPFPRVFFSFRIVPSRILSAFELTSAQ
jgi:hypothetical protein